MNDDRVIFEAAARLTSQGERFALVTVVRTAGSTPRKPGAKMIVRASGESVGSVGGGAIEQALVDEARAALAAGEPRLVRRHLTHDLAMCCGGEVEAFIEPLGQRELLVLFGGGHINAALCPIAAQLGFEVIVCDDLEELASEERFPAARRLVRSFEVRDVGAAFDAGTSVVVATRDHAVDQRVLEQLFAAGASPRYLGVIGSQAKLLKFRRRLEAKGVGGPFIASIRGPIGVHVGAQTPAEIAVAVAAELVAVRRGVEVVAKP